MSLSNPQLLKLQTKIQRVAKNADKTNAQAILNLIGMLKEFELAYHLSPELSGEEKKLIKSVVMTILHETEHS